MVGSLNTECGVTANILDLGSSDSGFESRHSDNKRSFCPGFEQIPGIRGHQTVSGIWCPEISERRRGNFEGETPGTKTKNAVFFRDSNGSSVYEPTTACRRTGGQDFSIDLNFKEYSDYKIGNTLVV